MSAHPPEPNPSLPHTSLTHTYTHTTHAPRLPSIHTNDHARKIGARAAVSMLVNFRQRRPLPLDGCVRSQLLNIFTSADRFVFIIYHRSWPILSSPLLFFWQVPSLSPGQSRRRKSLLSFRFGSIPAVLFLLSLFFRRCYHHLSYL